MRIQSRACLGTIRRVMSAKPFVVDGFLDEAQQNDGNAAQMHSESGLTLVARIFEPVLPSTQPGVLSGVKQTHRMIA